jgi:hypothetical protein
MISQFPHALTPGSASERGACPLPGFMLAPFLTSSQDVVRTVVRVRCNSSELATVRYSRHTRSLAGYFLNLFGPLQAARRFSSTLRQFCQEPRGVFTVLFRPCLRGLLLHEQHNGAKHGREVVEPRQAYVSE